jgi:diguanylate cyclase (GGDEF)-like protein/PAS domain S-box-containing protein
MALSPTNLAHEFADAVPQSVYEAHCRTACALFSVPWALIHVGDARKRKKVIGIGVAAWEASIESSVRGLLPLSREMLIIEDATHDPRFGAGRSAASALRIRFYASIPLFTESDVHAGTLCLMDSSPRTFTDGARQQLQDLARILSACISLEDDARRASEQLSLYRLLAENSTDTLVRGNLDGIRLYVSPSVRALLGYEPGELVGRRAREILHPDEAQEFGKLMADVREGRIDIAVTEHRQRHKDGSWVWLEAFIKLTRDKVSGRPDGYVVSVRDISRRKEGEARLEHMALHDSLTGLPNRALFHKRLSHELSWAARSGQGFALLCLDLDQFKLVNDMHGHIAGDTVLRTMTARFRSIVRIEDTVARLGGDEFVVIQATSVDASASSTRLAARLIQAASEPIDFDGKRIQLGLSIGIAIAPMAGTSADELLSAADGALYRAKQGGRNRHYLWCDADRQ